MNWRGEKETATVSIIEQKIGEFLRNHTNRLRSGGPSQGTSSESFSTPAQLGEAVSSKPCDQKLQTGIERLGHSTNH